MQNDTYNFKGRRVRAYIEEAYSDLIDPKTPQELLAELRERAVTVYNVYLSKIVTAYEAIVDIPNAEISSTNLIENLDVLSLNLEHLQNLHSLADQINTYLPDSIRGVFKQSVSDKINSLASSIQEIKNVFEINDEAVEEIKLSFS